MASPVVLVATLLAAFGASQIASADGTLRFSGRIAESPCTLQISAIDRAIALADCPLAAQGSQLSVHHIAGAGAARLVDPASGIALHHLALGAQSVGPQMFSSRYALDAPLHAGTADDLYQVRLDYL